MSNLQLRLRTYFEIIDSLAIKIDRLKQLLNCSDFFLTESDAKYLVGGQLSNLAEELASLSKEIEEEPSPAAVAG